MDTLPVKTSSQREISIEKKPMYPPKGVQRFFHPQKT